MTSSDSDSDSDPWAHLGTQEASPWQHLSKATSTISQAHCQAERQSTKRALSSSTAAGTQQGKKLKCTVDLGPKSLHIGQPGAPNLQNSDPPGDFSHYAKQGQDPEHIRNRLAKSMHICRCSHPAAPCSKDIPLQKLIETCRLFWSISSSQRAHLLRCLYYQKCRQDSKQDCDESSSEDVGIEPHQTSSQWSMCGRPVCLAVFTGLLGTSQPTLWKCIYGKTDARTKEFRLPRLVQHTAHLLIDMWFWELYNSAAEPLPNEISDLATEPDISVLNPELHAVTHLSSWATASHSQVIGIPKRRIMKTTLTNLYWSFVSSWEVQDHGPEEQSPSFSLFVQRWRLWKQVLCMRKSSEHAQCKVCWALHQRMSDNKSSWSVRSASAQALQKHLQHQYLDRCVYWSLRLASERQKNVLTIIIDSMDKAKFAFPRWHFKRLPKGMDQAARPKLVLTASIAHGYCHGLYMSHDDLCHGASYFLEIVARTIVKVQEICEARQIEFPDHLVLQSDNTPAQAKNNESLQFLAMLVARRTFQTCTLNFLTVGHTHEDVDQLFGLITSWMSQIHSFSTPEEVLQLLEESLIQKLRGRWSKVYSEFVSGIRHWNSWLTPLNCRFHGGLQHRSGVEAPHSFSLKHMSSLSGAEQVAGQENPPGWLPNPDDVMICVKAFMRDHNLQQPAMPRLPPNAFSRLQSLLPAQVISRQPLKPNLAKTYLDLARFAEAQNLQEAADALRSLVHDRNAAAISNSYQL